MRSTRESSHDRAESGAGTPEQRAQRAELRARLAAERADLLGSLLGIDENMLEVRPVMGDFTVTDMLVRIARGEERCAALIRGGDERSSSDEQRQPEPDINRNTFSEALRRCVDARRRLLDMLALLSDDELFGTAVMPRATTPLELVNQCQWNDSALSLRISSWSQHAGLGTSVGPAAGMLAALHAARKELLLTLALVPNEARDLPVFEDGRPLSQVLQMISGLERAFVRALASHGYSAPLLDSSDNGGGEPKSGNTWDGAWKELHRTRTHVLHVLGGLPESEFSRSIADASGRGESLYMWARGCFAHDRLHAAYVRADLQLDWPERLLR